MCAGGRTSGANPSASACFCTYTVSVPAHPHSLGRKNQITKLCETSRLTRYRGAASAVTQTITHRLSLYVGLQPLHQILDLDLLGQGYDKILVHGDDGVDVNLGGTLGAVGGGGILAVGAGLEAEAFKDGLLDGGVGD